MLLRNDVSILVILDLDISPFKPANFVTTAEWSDVVRDQSATVLSCCKDMLADHCILSILDIFSPCLQVIVDSKLFQQSTRFRSLNIEEIFSATSVSFLLLLVFIRSVGQNVVLKSPIIIMSQLSLLLHKSVTFSCIASKNFNFSLLCGHGACKLTIINELDLLLAITSVSNT